MKALIILIFSIFVCHCAFAQTDNADITKPKTVKVGNIKSSLIFQSDFSGKDIKYMLKTEACKEAYFRANLTESVRSYFVIISETGNSCYTDEQIYKNLSIGELEGIVKYDKIRFFPEEFIVGQVCSVELINARVELYPLYNIEITKIEGLKNIYKDGEEIKFKFKFNTDSYLRIVAIQAKSGEGDVKRLYPNPEAMKEETKENVTVDNDLLFKADVFYSFPAILGDIKLTANLNAGEKRDILYLAFIATSNRKKDLGDGVNYETFFKWYFEKLNHSERSQIYIIPLTIEKK